ncbi:Roundabout-like 1, partial [Ophiophagus hannah]
MGGAQQPEASQEMDFGVWDGEAEATSVTCVKLVIARSKDIGDERYGRAMERDGSRSRSVEFAPQILDHPSNLVVRKDQPATLNCRADGNPAPTIEWYRNGKYVKPSKEDATSQPTLLPDGSLFFLRLSQEKGKSDEGVYHCLARNHLGKAMSKNASLYLEVLEEEFRLHPSDLKVTIGESWLLECVPPLGHPEPTISWKKNGVPLSAENGHYEFSKEKLLVAHAQKSDAGAYSCLAVNQVGEQVSRAATVTVFERPTFIRRPSDVVASVGSSVQFICGIHGDPKLVVQWYKEDGELPSGRYEVDQENVLQIHHLTMCDAGKYICAAYSHGGTIFAKAALTVEDPLDTRQKEWNRPKDVTKELVDIRVCLVNVTIVPSAPAAHLHWKKDYTKAHFQLLYCLKVTPTSQPIEAYKVFYHSLLPTKAHWAEWDVARDQQTIIPGLERGYKYEFKVRPYLGKIHGIDSNVRQLYIPEEAVSFDRQSQGSRIQTIPLVPDSSNSSPYEAFRMNLPAKDLKTFYSSLPYLSNPNIQSMELTQVGELMSHGSQNLRTDRASGQGRTQQGPWKAVGSLSPNRTIRGSWAKYDKKELQQVHSTPMSPSGFSADWSNHSSPSSVVSSGKHRRVNGRAKKVLKTYSSSKFSLCSSQNGPSLPPPPPIPPGFQALQDSSTKQECSCTCYLHPPEDFMNQQLDKDSLKTVKESLDENQSFPTLPYNQLSAASVPVSLSDDQETVLTPEEVAEYLELSTETDCQSYGYICGPLAIELLENDVLDEDEDPNMVEGPCSSTKFFHSSCQTPSSSLSEDEASLGGSLVNGWGSVSEDNGTSTRCSLVSSSDGSFLLDANFAQALAVAVDSFCFGLAKKEVDRPLTDFLPPVSPLDGLLHPQALTKSSEEVQQRLGSQPLPVWEWSTDWVEEMEAKYRQPAENWEAAVKPGKGRIAAPEEAQLVPTSIQQGMNDKCCCSKDGAPSKCSASGQWDMGGFEALKTLSDKRMMAAEVSNSWQASPGVDPGSETFTVLKEKYTKEGERDSTAQDTTDSGISVFRSSVESEAGWAGDLAQPRLAGQLDIVSLAGTRHDLYEWLIAVK